MSLKTGLVGADLQGLTPEAPFAALPLPSQTCYQ